MISFQGVLEHARDRSIEPDVWGSFNTADHIWPRNGRWSRQYGGEAPGLVRCNRSGEGIQTDEKLVLIELANLESRARAAASWVHERFAVAERTALETGASDPMEVALARQATVHATQDGAEANGGA